MSILSHDSVKMTVILSGFSVKSVMRECFIIQEVIIEGSIQKSVQSQGSVKKKIHYVSWFSKENSNE